MQNEGSEVVKLERHIVSPETEEGAVELIERAEKMNVPLTEASVAEKGKFYGVLTPNPGRRVFTVFLPEGLTLEEAISGSLK